MNTTKMSTLVLLILSTLLLLPNANGGELLIGGHSLKPLPGLTNLYYWITVTYKGPATNHWTMRLLPKDTVDGEPFATNIVQSNYIHYEGIEFNKMVWALPYSPTNRAAFFGIELLEEE